jgi:hypothetical protein
MRWFGHDKCHHTRAYFFTSRVRDTTMVLASLLSQPYGALDGGMKLSVTPSSTSATFDWSDFPLVHQHNPDVVFEPCETWNKPSHERTLSSSCSSVDSEISSSSTLSSKSCKCVSFAPFVQVREYAVVVGDHPFCQALPLSLDWKYTEEQSVDYSSQSRRHGPQLRLTYYERRNILRVAGYTEADLRQAERQQVQESSPLRHIPTATRFSVL